MNSLLKHRSAWIPIAMSLAVLAIWLIGMMIFGVPVREPDEGTGAHLFQIWLVLEILMMTFFAIKWLPQRPTQALLVLAIQIIVALAACAPIFILKL